jgi:hypothetical protein
VLRVCERKRNLRFIGNARAPLKMNLVPVNLVPVLTASTVSRAHKLRGRRNCLITQLLYRTHKFVTLQKSFSIMHVLMHVHCTLVAVSAPFVMPLRDSDIPMNVPFTLRINNPACSDQHSGHSNEYSLYARTKQPLNLTHSAQQNENLFPRAWVRLVFVPVAGRAVSPPLKPKGWEF